MKLIEAVPPKHLKLAFYGLAGSGKTWTAARMLAEFAKRHRPKARLAMFDTEGGAGFVDPVVRSILGTPLLSVAATSFGELKEFLALCRTEGHIGLIDSATHIWRALVTDFLDAKRSRARAAGNANPESVRLALNDWGPIKEVWNTGFADPFKFDASDLCYCGRCGDNWELVRDEEGKETMQATGTKMKIESESAYEPSLLIEMIRVPNPRYDPITAPKESQWLHRAEVVKDRAGILTGRWADDPGYEFIAPHVEFLLPGKHVAPATNAPATFGHESGPNYSTLMKRRAAVVESVKDELLLKYPGQSAEEKKKKVLLLRKAFGDNASWTAIEDDVKTYPEDVLRAGLDVIRKERTDGAESQ